ncbi:hypothetical protein PVAP13_6KG137606 [Panicum virgatum]|uniref:Uncharacterized protein n=1 Tax=Panicum virgatum TaxID=38727 RepID=A0A8T0RDU3_PANVG|nr:hypothetical protein PVAP13_6KG137606 [Panicum virgatum]
MAWYYRTKLINSCPICANQYPCHFDSYISQGLSIYMRISAYIIFKQKLLFGIPVNRKKY